MPIFEYECRDCRERFELLIRGAESAACPACGSVQAERLFSPTAAHVRGTNSLPISTACPPSGAPPCGPGCCRLG